MGGHGAGACLSACGWSGLCWCGTGASCSDAAALGSGSAGSVSTRARKYRLSWDEANPGLCGSCDLQDGQHGRGPPEVEQSAAVGGHMLMVAGARAEDV